MEVYLGLKLTAISLSYNPQYDSFKSSAAYQELPYDACTSRTFKK